MQIPPNPAKSELKMSGSAGLDNNRNHSQIIEKKIKLEELKCVFCDVKFALDAEDSYFQHLEAKMCNVCSDTFDCNSKLVEHRKLCQKVQVKPKWKCDLCSRILDMKSRGNHKTVRKCKKCGLELACGGIAAKHNVQCKKKKRMQNGKVAVKWTKCNECGDFYSSDKNHLGKEATCHKCKTKFACRSRCLEHQRLVCFKDLTCDFCGLFCVSKTRLETHAKKRNCLNCDHVSCCYKLFNAHKCEESDKETEEEKVSEDENSTVSVEEPVVAPLLIKKCAFCKHLCNSEEAFECHTRQTKCPHCKFPQPCNTLLAHHLNVCRFEGEEPEEFQCGECEKVFKRRHKLESHKRRRHVQRSSILAAEAILGMVEKKIIQTAERNIINKLIVKSEPIPVIDID
ncbi:zinc finger protein 600-like [Neocloeon triangulifer]|uniref:zinc finger protein 600-like n=1 Tax=Neocloeon triangulifer TaxID=2078957 RepID=UPI00286F3627|nr:zinc finger protein 600-like [Neocloeon triangulifer]